jgi:DNA-binding protein H-NS
MESYMPRRSREEEMTLQQVRSEISRLETRAEKLEQEERKIAYFAKVKEGLDVLNLSVDELLAGLAAVERASRPGRGKAPKKQRKVGAAAVTYGDGNGATWSGRGRSPQWFRDAISAGKTKEELLVPSGAATPTAESPRSDEVPSKKKTAPKQAKYSDGLGNTWSGFGPKPKWLREGIEAGRTLESFAA